MSPKKKVVISSRLRELQRPWFRNGIEPELEKLIRFGGKIIPHHFTNKYMIWRWRTGRAGTVMGDEADEKSFRAFSEIAKEEYFPAKARPEISKHVREALCGFLNSHGVTLTDQESLLSHEIYSIIYQIMSVLPTRHMGHEHFRELEIGGWSGTFAECSEYCDGVVHLYSFALQGPKRNMAALLLHEIGHSFIRLLTKDELDTFEMLRWHMNSSMPEESLMGVDYLRGEESRIERFLSDLNEFIAETYMMYVTQGAVTEEGLKIRRRYDSRYRPSVLEDSDYTESRIRKFMDSLEDQHRKIWDALWNLHYKCFNRIEYV